MLSYLLLRAVNFVGRYITAAGVALYSLTLGLVSPRQRSLLSHLARQGGFPELPRPRLPVVAISAVTRDDTTVSLPFPEGADGNVTLVELLTLTRLARERRPAAVFEIGTFHGRTTRALAENALDATVYTLDLPADHPTKLALVGSERTFVNKPVSGALFAGSPAAARVRQLYGDSATFDFAPYQVDFVFVDGSHAYEYVLSDSRRSLAMLRGGRGVILWHDYAEWAGVTRALDELYRSDAAFAGLRRVGNTTLAILEV